MWRREFNSNAVVRYGDIPYDMIYMVVGTIARSVSRTHSSVNSMHRHWCAYTRIRPPPFGCEFSAVQTGAWRMHGPVVPVHRRHRQKKERKPNPTHKRRNSLTDWDDGESKITSDAQIKLRIHFPFWFTITTNDQRISKRKEKKKDETKKTTRHRIAIKIVTVELWTHIGYGETCREAFNNNNV